MHFAIISGLFAALGSSFGKLCSLPAIQDYLIVKILSFVLMITFNTLVMTFHIKAMHWSGSTISATVASTAANYVFSALSGIFIFGEKTSLIWWVGMIFIITGLTFIVSDETGTGNKEQEQQEHNLNTKKDL